MQTGSSLPGTPAAASASQHCGLQPHADAYLASVSGSDPCQEALQQVQAGSVLCFDTGATAARGLLISWIEMPSHVQQVYTRAMNWCCCEAFSTRQKSQCYSLHCSSGSGSGSVWLSLSAVRVIAILTDCRPVKMHSRQRETLPSLSARARRTDG